MKRTEKRVLIIVLALALASVGAAVIVPVEADKWLNRAGLLFDIAGLVQLEIAGLFKFFSEEYADDKKYPYGPPSHITREIVDNDMTVSRARGLLFSTPQTGFMLIVLGCTLQLIGTWL